MFQNDFTIKHYDKDSDFIQVVDPKNIKNEISFTAQKNWWQWQLRLVLNIWFVYNNFSHWDYIKVYVVNTFNPNGYLLYSGYIHDINLLYDWQETIELSIYWLASLLNDVLYKDGSDLEFDQTDDPADILLDVITAHNSDYPGIIQAWDIETYWTTISYNVNKQTCFDVIKAVTEISEDYYWYVDQTGALNFKEIGDAEHRFIYGTDIETLTQNQEATIFNKLYLEYDGWSQTYTDAVSIALYGVKEIAITDTSIKDLTTANSFAAAYFVDNAYTKNEVNFTINTLYEQRPADPFWDDTELWDDTEFRLGSVIGSYETIKPGQVVRIQNIETTITGQVERITYRRQKMQVSLNKFDNFTQLIQN